VKEILLGKKNKTVNTIAQVLLPPLAIAQTVARMSDKASRGKPVGEKQYKNLAVGALMDVAGPAILAGRVVRNVAKTAKPTPTFVKMSRNVYEPVEKRAEHIDGYQIIKQLGDKKTAVYHNPSTKKSVIAHTGWIFGDDAPQVKKLATGKLDHTDPRVKHSLEIHDFVKKNLGGDITHTGHSLGGTIADISASSRNAKVETYAKAGSPLLSYKSTKASHNRHFVTPFDFISMSHISHPNTHIVLPNRKGVKYAREQNNPFEKWIQLNHSLQNFE